MRLKTRLIAVVTVSIGGAACTVLLKRAIMSNFIHHQVIEQQAKKNIKKKHK